jgi:hypothetical protein
VDIEQGLRRVATLAAVSAQLSTIANTAHTTPANKGTTTNRQTKPMPFDPCSLIPNFGPPVLSVSRLLSQRRAGISGVIWQTADIRTPTVSQTVGKNWRELV